MSTPVMPTRRTLISAIGVAAALSACGGGGGSDPAPITPTPTPTPPTVAQTISLSMPASRILGSRPVTLTATLGQSADVSWSLAGGNPGTLSATSGTSVTYTPPASGVAGITPITITATSAGVSASARLALTPDPRQRTGLALLAGDLGGRGLIDGNGSTARFENIVAMDIDASGNLLLADLTRSTSEQPQPSVLRQVSAAGDVITLTPRELLSYGHADGSITGGAQLGTVSGLAAAPDGAIYLIDKDDSARLRVLRGGRLLTLQNNVPGSRVTTDRNGTVYVYDNTRILRVSADGASSAVLAGAAIASAQADGQGSAARFWSIADVAADANGNLYVSDSNTVRKVTPAGVVTTLAGQASAPLETIDGSGAAARFGYLQALAFDTNGNLQVLDELADATNQTGYTIRQITPAGITTTVLRGAAPPSLGEAPAPAIVTRVARLRFNPLLGRLQLAHTAQIDVIADGQVQEFAGLEGNSSSEVDGIGSAARFVRPSHLGADLAGNVYTLDFPAPYGGARKEDTHGLWLRKITPDGTVSALVTDPTFSLKPNGIVADADGNLFVSAGAPETSLSAHSGGGVFKITQNGTVSLFAGSASTGSAPSADGAGSGAAFVAPQLEGIDVAGNLYLRDVDKIRRVTPQAMVTTVSSLPDGLKAAPNGLVYTTDYSQQVIYATDANGVRSIAVGVPGIPGTRLSALPAGLEGPLDIVPTGPHSFAVISGAAVLRLLLPN